MRPILLAAVTIALGGCAGSPGSPIGSANPQAQADFAPRSAPEELQLAAVFELQPVTSNPDTDPEGVVCHEEYPTGSRILRTRCTAPPLRAQEDAREDQIRWDLEYADRIAAIQEQIRLQESIDARMRRADE